MTRSRSLTTVLLATAVLGLAAVPATTAATPEARAAAKQRGPVRVPGRRGRRRPAQAKPRDKQLGLTAVPDPLAPAGRTPKVLFEVRNAVRGRSYRIFARHMHGQPQYAPGNPDTPQCNIGIGNTTPNKSPISGTFPWGRTPADFSDPSDGYDAIGGSPCQGAWEGELEELGGKGRSIEFVMAIPEMTIDVVGRYG